eukprot:Gb_25808 [translate_table: standard]
MTLFVKSVIWELKLQLRELYNLGLRNFLVSNVLSFDRMPGFVQNACQYGAVCGKTSMDLVSMHNKFLSEAIAELRELEDANFLILDLFSAFSCIVSKPSAYGNNMPSIHTMELLLLCRIVLADLKIKL